MTPTEHFRVENGWVSLASVHADHCHHTGPSDAQLDRLVAQHADRVLAALDRATAPAAQAVRP